MPRQYKLINSIIPKVIENRKCNSIIKEKAREHRSIDLSLINCVFEFLIYGICFHFIGNLLKNHFKCRVADSQIYKIAKQINETIRGNKANNQ